MIPPAKSRQQGRGRGRGRGKGRGKGTNKTDASKKPAAKEDLPLEHQTDNVMVEVVVRFEKDGPLEVIQEDENMDSRTTHSNDTVRQSNVPEVMQTRLSLNLTVLPSEDRPDKVLIETSKKWFAKMLEVDTKCKLIPWFSDDHKEGPVESFKEIPTMLSRFRKYFCRARPKIEGGSVYMEIYMQHTKSIEEIKEDAEWWLKKEKSNMYVKSIQAATTARLGWLLFSFPEMNTKVFSQELSTLVGEQVAARYKPVLTGKWDPSMDPKARLKAIHLECDKKVEKKVKLQLSGYYSSTSKEFPMGIRMRLVPEFVEIKGNQAIVQKVANLRAKQSHFLQAIVHISSEDIINLDVTTSSSPITLRQRIMEIKSWTGTKSTLFHAVNESWDGNRIVFTCTPPNAENASLLVQAIIPYMIFQHGDGIKDFLDPNMLLEKEEWKWSEDDKTLDNPQTRTIQGIDGVDLDYDFKEHVEINLLHMETEGEIKGVRQRLH